MRTLPSCFGRLRYFSKGLSPSPQASVASIDPVLDILDSSDPYRLTENRNRGNTLPVMAMPHFQMATIPLPSATDDSGIVRAEGKLQ
jgi:hypothetical protein